MKNLIAFLEEWLSLNENLWAISLVTMKVIQLMQLVIQKQSWCKLIFIIFLFHLRHLREY